MTRRIHTLPLLLLTGFLFGAGSLEVPPVVQAAKDSDWTELVTLVADGSDLNAVYADGTSALHWVSYRDNVEMASLLIARGANVNATTDIGATPLWLAAENGSSLMVQTLLEAGANPNVSQLSGESLVMTASLAGNEAVVEQLLKASADPNVAATRGQTALMWAAGRGHSGAVRALLKYGADVHSKSEVQRLLMKTDKEQYSHPDFKVWVEQGGNTALMFAARSGDLASTVLLVEAGSEVNATSAFGLSPAIMAVHGGNADLVAFLGNSGADLNAADPGYTALHAAVLERNYPAVKVLLAQGADPNATVEKASPTRRQSLDFNFHETFVGATPLWLAARFTQPDMMRILLEHGADPHFLHSVRYPAGGDGVPFSIVEEGEISILMAALGMGNRRLVRRSRMGRTEGPPLDSRTREALVHEAVKIAIDAGVDINLHDASNTSAIDVAKNLRYASVVALLNESGSVSE